MDGLVVLSSPYTQDYVACSSQHVKTKGKLFKKQIFRWGPFSHPKNPDIKINVDRDFYDKLKANFDNRVCPIVQFPLVDADNRHVENPDSNIGVVTDLAADEEGVYAYIDVRKHQEDVGETILGASAKVHLNYTDRLTGEAVGPTLVHVAATNNPYLTNLRDFETVSASDADTNSEVVLLLSDVGEAHSEEETSMTKDELIAELSKHGVDVVAGQQALADLEGYVALSDVLEGDDVVATPQTISTTIVELSNAIKEKDTQISEQDERIQALTSQINEVNLSAATQEVESLITQGRILPAWKDDMVELSLSDRKRFENFLLPEGIATAELSEVGFTTTEDTHDVDPLEAAREEGLRLAGLAQNRRK